MTRDRRPARRHGFHPRVKDFREIVQRFLIVCEGTKTEPLYFESFKTPKDVRVIRVVGRGLDPLNLIEEAIKLREKGEYDQVWCVFDVEDHPVEVIHSAIGLAEKNSIRIAVSNQAFELWYLLHFNYYHTATDRRQYSDRLTALLGFRYEKNISIYRYLIDRQSTAIRNARRLLQEYRPHDPAICNPSTTVHELVAELNHFAPEART